MRPFTRLKIAVFAPMPSARGKTATMEKPGLRASWRNPWRRSCRIWAIILCDTESGSRSYRNRPGGVFYVPRKAAAESLIQDHTDLFRGLFGQARLLLAQPGLLFTKHGLPFP